MRLNNLTLIINHPNALLITNKQLKLSTGLKTFTTSTTAKKLSEGQIKWDDMLQIPASDSINFEIVTKHQFGYNPQQLEGVVHGKISFGREPPREMKLITSPVYSLQGEKVGHLKVDCTATSLKQSSPKSKSVVIAPAQNIEKSGIQQIRVTSIIANVESIKGQVAVLGLKSGRESRQTSEFKSKAGQLIFLDDIILPREPGQNSITVTLFSKNNGQIQPQGQAEFQISHDGTLQKKALIKHRGAHVGDMFIEGKIVELGSSKDALSLLLSRNFESSAMVRSSRARSSLHSHGKNYSVMCSNNQIKMPKEKRFFEMAGQRKSSVVSYQNPSSIIFPQQKGKVYRGASMGRGYKTDFSRYQGQDINPGPGEYRLPTIWDRY